ncbi:MAG: hypothetical protein RL338_1596 [Chloroflexota bacterium]
MNGTVGRAASRSAAAPATGRRSLDLAPATTRLARALAARGVGAGDRVALIVAPSPAAVAALAALGRLDAVAVPLGTRSTPRELAAAIATIRPRLVIHDAAHAAALAEAAAAGPAAGAAAGAGPAGIDVVALEALAPDGLATLGAPETVWAVHGFEAPGDVALRTSGTTGTAKTALLRRTALEASARAWEDALPPAEAWLLPLGLAHVAGIGVVVRAALAGVPLVGVDGSDAAAILAALEGAGGRAIPTHLPLVPTQLARLLDVAGDRHAPATLRAVLLGGGPIPPALVLRALERGWPVVPTYGLTEAGSGVTALPTAEAAGAPASAGRPLPGVVVTIDAPGPDGAGEILVATPARFDCYLDDPVATAASLDAAGRLRTGDVGRLDAAGRLEVLDRRTDLVVSGGENVAPAEVEAALLEHPAVADAGVVGRPDPAWGSVPVAAVVLRPGAPDPGDDGLRAHCRERLASYKVPASFVRLAALPRTATGKLRRAELRTALLAMLPATDAR